ncbi:alanine racemase [Phytoactinopolyspora limicola]|uniref:alanine racemase n=1 Tax=Phytoactinopolyspora limicola TaxID=2715536 RepID=UPI001409DD12|nr:alanine racemase [Phytoactinopolyspora limicola]
MIDWRCKSFPPSADGVHAAQVHTAGWDLFDDFSTPIAVLDASALEHNLDTMRRFCAERGVRLAPHGKTTMSPELITRQLAHGAWGMTAATAWQARAMVTMGARRVIIANECLDPPGLGWIVERMRDDPGLELFVFADSSAAVRQMTLIVNQIDGGRALPVLVEVGVPGGRAGARDVASAVAVGEAIASAPGLELAGVAGFEGVIGGARDPATLTQVRAFLATIRTTAQELMTRRAFRSGAPVLLSAGGSMFFDLVADQLTPASGGVGYHLPVEVVIRSGCYLTHDHGIYHANTPLGGPDGLRPAMRVWSRVISTPQPHLVIIDAGKRDISSDTGMPTVLARRRDGHVTDINNATNRGSVVDDVVVVDHFNDQHGFVHTTTPGTLQVGDLVALGVSHPCTTFDKWRAIPVVDHEHRVIEAIRTCF